MVKHANAKKIAVKCHTGNKRAGASAKKNFRSKTMHAVDIHQMKNSLLVQ